MALKVWSWLKKNWKWVLFPIGILVALATLSKRHKTTVIALPDTHATDHAILQHDAELKKREEAAETKATAELKAIEEKHAAVIEQLGDSQRLQFDELKKDPQALTDWLIKVGRGDA